MAKEDTPLDQGVFDSTLEAELAKGTDRRVAEGRARSAAVRAYRAANPEEAAKHDAAGAAPAAAAAGAPAAGAAAAAAGGARRRTCGRGRCGGRAGHHTDARSPAAHRQHARRRRRAPTTSTACWRWCRPRASSASSASRATASTCGRTCSSRSSSRCSSCSPACTLFSTFINAPLRELANPNLTPNPSKAPWYFLGLQELLRYFHPMVAGITIPTFILVGLAAVPYVDRNPSNKPGDRKIAITLFTILFMFGGVLTIIGSFFRGPGYNWVWPWAQGVFFEL